MDLYRSTRKDSPLSPHFVKAMVHLSVIRILRLRSASEIWIAGLVGFRFLTQVQVRMLPTPLPRRQLLVMWMMEPLWWQQRGVLRQLGLETGMLREPAQRAPLLCPSLCPCRSRRRRRHAHASGSALAHSRRPSRQWRAAAGQHARPMRVPLVFQ
jgi:hypothetical protein